MFDCAAKLDLGGLKTLVCGEGICFVRESLATLYWLNCQSLFLFVFTLVSFLCVYHLQVMYYIELIVLRSLTNYFGLRNRYCVFSNASCLAYSKLFLVSVSVSDWRYLSVLLKVCHFINYLI